MLIGASYIICCSPNSDPVSNILTGHQWLQVVPAHVVRRSLIDLLRNSLQQAHWDISDKEIWREYWKRLSLIQLEMHYFAMYVAGATYNSPAHEGEPLKHESAGLLHTTGVRAPVLQAKVGEIPEDVQSLTGWDVPVPALLYFSKDPGLNEGTPAETKVKYVKLIQNLILLKLFFWARLNLNIPSTWILKAQKCSTANSWKLTKTQPS